MTLMNYLGFDFGLKRIGVAAGQDITRTAKPLLILKAVNGEPVWAEIGSIIQDWRPVALVVGVPHNPEHVDQSTVVRAKQFAQSLGQQFKLPVHTVDEHLTSFEAKQRLREQGDGWKIGAKQIDSMAACIILESWLNQC